MGPLRVWPGGLAMGRTIGDASAGSVATCEPEIRQVGIQQTFKCSAIVCHDLRGHVLHRAHWDWHSNR